MGDAAIAAAIVLPLSGLLVAIEISRAARSSLAHLFTGPTLLYFLIVCIGNIFTTLLAASTTSQNIPGTAPGWFWYVILGVFGFEAILKNINLTFAGFGVLSINDWITKAKDAATADAIAADVLLKEQQAVSLAQRLKQLPDKELNSYIITILGANQLQPLEAAATRAMLTRS